MKSLTKKHINALGDCERTMIIWSGMVERKVTKAKYLSWANACRAAIKLVGKDAQDNRKG